MQLKDLPESLQMEVLRISNAYMRAHPELDIHLTSHIDQAVINGMEFEARRHNSKAENLWQVLNAFYKIIETSGQPTHEVLNMVDQCLKENKPEII